MDSACPVNASEYLGHLTLIADASQLVDRPDEYGRQVPIDFIIDDVNGDSSIRKFASRIGAYMKQPGLRGSKIDAHRRRLATRAVHNRWNHDTCLPVASDGGPVALRTQAPPMPDEQPG